MFQLVSLLIKSDEKKKLHAPNKLLFAMSLTQEIAVH